MTSLRKSRRKPGRSTMLSVMGNLDCVDLVCVLKIRTVLFVWGLCEDDKFKEKQF